MLRFAAVVSCALALAGCATVNYLQTEYGSSPKDATVTLDDGTGWWIWLSKTKPKMIVSVDAGQAMAMGMASGLTFGGASGAIPPPLFEKVATKYLAENKPGCRFTRGVPIDRMYYEFDLDCTPVVQQRTPALTDPERRILERLKRPAP